MARVPAGVKRAEIIELLEIKEQLKPLQAREKELADKVKRAHGPLLDAVDAKSITRPYGPAIVTVLDKAKFDVASFSEKYPVLRHPVYYASTVDSKAVPDELRGRFVILERSLSVVRAS